MDKASEEVNANSNDVRVLTIGDFEIRVQENCEYDVPEIPEPPKAPSEIECVAAEFDAKVLAKTVAKLTKENP